MLSLKKRLKHKEITMKRIIIFLLICTMLSMSLVSCGSRAPERDEVYDRIVELVEGANEINTVLYGAGLATYERGTAEDTLLHRYYGVADDGREYVSPYAEYASIEDIKSAMTEVYSSSYCASLFESLFTGYAMEEGTHVLPARFTEDEAWMYQNKYANPSHDVGMRSYDYATMRIMPESNARYLVVEIDSRVDSDSAAWKTIDLSFVFENGNWYLDGPSC